MNNSNRVQIIRIEQVVIKGKTENQSNYKKKNQSNLEIIVKKYK